MGIPGNIHVNGATALPPEPAAPAGQPDAGATLLPSPSSPPDIGDGIARLMAISSQIGDAQMKQGMASVNANANRQKAASAARKEALERAADAARKAQEDASKGGLFDFVTDNIGLVGLVGLVTFRPDIVLMDVAAHKAELTDGDTDLLGLGALAAGGPLAYAAEQAFATYAPAWCRPEDVAAFMLAGPLGTAIQRGASKLTPEDLKEDIRAITSIEDDDVRVANKIALSVALTAAAATATVLTGGATSTTVVALVGIGISTATQVASATGLLEEICSEKAAMWISLGGSAAGVLLTLGGSLGNAGASAATAMKRAGAMMNAGLSVVQGSDEVMQGVHQLRAAEHTYRADLANADAEEQRHVLKRLERVVDGILDDLREAKEAPERASQTLQATLQTYNQGLLQAASMKV